MTVIILSIKRKYAEAILSGVKKCELRKGSFPRDVSLALIYSSNHDGLITGWFTVKRKVEGTPKQVWEKFSEDAHISKEDFDRYYEGSKKAVALVIGKYQKLDAPINPFKEFKGFVAPQSFMYPRESDMTLLTQRIEPLREQTLESRLGP